MVLVARPTTRDHLLAADDARAVRLQVFRRRLGQHLVHMCRGTAISDEVCDTSAEASERPPQVAHEMQRESVVREHDQEKYEVHKKVQEIRDKLEVEDVDALRLPPSTCHRVDHSHGILDCGGHHAGCEDHVLEREEHEHARAVAPRCCHGVGQKQHVNGQEQGEQRDCSHVRGSGNGWCRLDMLEPVLRQPVERLDKDEKREEGDERRVELFSEYGHGKARLHHGILGAFPEPLHLRISQRTEEDHLEYLPENQQSSKREVSEQHDRHLAGCEVDERGVELLSRCEGVVCHGSGSRDARDNVLA
mmetsp:Transcript_15168/g.40094  ORF Transcript_15168/g.40094 Transcript_15168/m.40094 type:complete len:305 (+) Transcript_15168:195-1109(+)